MKLLTCNSGSVVRRLRWWTLLLVILLVHSVQAEWVRVTGQAPVRGGDLNAARKEAQEDAMRQAVLQAGAEVVSEDRMEQGLLTQSRLDVRSKASVRRVVQVEEEVFDDTLSLTLDVDVISTELELCSGIKTNEYRRHLALLGFAMQTPAQADVGRLYDIDRALPAALNARLGTSNRLLVHQASQIQLYHELVNAPTHETEQRTLTKAVDAARELGVQFVVSGVVRDVSVRDPEAYGYSVVKKVSRWLTTSDLKRAFVVDMFIHDGFSGAIIFEKRYSTLGEWDADGKEARPLLSAAFRETDYGRKVSAVIGDMASDVERAVGCQPFMTRITRVEGKNILFEAGANSGIRPGDRFQIYRARQLYDGVRFQGTHLEDMRQALEVSRVQPEFASGALKTDPTRMNIQADDVIVSW